MREWAHGASPGFEIQKNFRPRRKKNFAAAWNIPDNQRAGMITKKGGETSRKARVRLV
jgi:hypothetical protein